MKNHKHSLAIAAVSAISALAVTDSLAGGIYQAAPQTSYPAYTGYPAGPQAYPAAPGYAVPNPGVEYQAPGAPPPPQQEIIIATPGPGYTWAGGYWHWQNGWIWIPGQWILPPRPGMRWFGPHWEPHHDGDRYRMEHGGWR